MKQNSVLNGDAFLNPARLIVLLVVAFSTVFFSALASAEMYKWIDDDGKVHFGDSPKADQRVEKVDVEVNTFKPVTYKSIDFSRPPAGGRTKKVTMYSTSWCGYCAKARDYFKKNNIHYVEYDIEKNDKAKRMYDLLGGSGVPVILVDKKRINGFSVTSFERIYR
jgi:glutaredoxin